MVEHVSPEGFLGGVLFGALLAWIAAYLIWGKGRNATKSLSHVASFLKQVIAAARERNAAKRWAWRS
jgi:uncharacterized membrane protein YccC